MSKPLSRSVGGEYALVGDLAEDGSGTGMMGLSRLTGCSSSVAGGVSVIVPTHSRMAMLEHVLAGLAAQTYTDTEIAIVDDGSRHLSDQIFGELNERLRRDSNARRSRYG